MCSPYVCSCRFDRFGALLAVASSHGRVKVFDADVIQSQQVASRGQQVDAIAPIKAFSVVK